MNIQREHALHDTCLPALGVASSWSFSCFFVLGQVYWGGGSVSGSLCDARWQKPKKDVSARLEDGTVNFLSIAAIRYGFYALQVSHLARSASHCASCHMQRATLAH